MVDPSVYDNRFLRVGDMGRIDEAGRLYLTGRKRRFIDTGGYKVHPAEIEDLLLTHPLVAEVAVVGIEAGGAEVVKAVIVARSDCNSESILAYCRDRLAGYKAPAVVEFTDKLPKSALGKESCAAA